VLQMVTFYYVMHSP